MAASSRFWRAAGPTSAAAEASIRRWCDSRGLLIQQLDESGLRVLTLSPEDERKADELERYLLRIGELER